MDFVLPPPKGLDTECSICFGSLHVDPYQNLNCGHHLCGNCVHKLKKEAYNCCPECRAPLQISADKSLQRVLKSLEVYCQHKGDGCTWQGDLGDLDHHEKDVCLYVKLSCPYGCGYIATRTLMDEHKRSTCSLRPANCKYCEFASTYVDVNDNHYSVCSLYPITCSCDETIPRKDLDDHKKMTCPNTEVVCKLVGYGCEWKGMRKDENGHLAVELSNHFMKVTEQLQARLEKNEVEFHKINKALEAKIVKLEQDNVALRTTLKVLENKDKLALLQYAAVKRDDKEREGIFDGDNSNDSDSYDDDDLTSNSSILSGATPSATPTTFAFKLDKFRKHQRYKKTCYSDPFEISTNYMMQLRIHPSGFGKGEGSHVSVYICLLLKPSPFASYMSPFHGSVHVIIRGVAGAINKKVITYDEDTPDDFTTCTSGTNKIGYLTSKGNGIPHFLPHKKLAKYLVDGCLSFEVYVTSH